MGEYFANKYEMSFRSIRYPGVISSQKYAFNGTTDYSTEIFFSLLEKGHYDVPLKEDSLLPMMYIDDCIDATVRFLQADPSRLKRKVYNLNGISFTPKELVKAIEPLIPGSIVNYKPDYRQAIADQWTNKLDDSTSTEDWGWTYDVTVPDLAKKILDGIDPVYKQNLKTL
jgi:threonine 3-dehydrogenase